MGVSPAQQAKQREEMPLLEYLMLQTVRKMALSKHALISQPSLLRWFSHNVTFSQEPLRNNRKPGAVCSFLQPVHQEPWCCLALITDGRLRGH